MEKSNSNSPTKTHKTTDVPEIKQFKNLPSCLIIEILGKLPMESLFACRCVCKGWAGFFSDPFFLKSHIARSPTCIFNRLHPSDGKLGFGWVVQEDVHIQVESGLGWAMEEEPNIHIESIEFDSGLNFPFEQLGSVNSCNGLVCLEDEKHREKHGYGGSFCLCNPLLRECVTIPLPRRDRFDSSKLAFGFSAKDNQYKVLHCFSFKKQEYGAEIYTLGTGQWRNIQVNPTCKLTRYDHLGFDTFLESRLHWTNMISLVCCFDFEIEEFKTFRLPPEHTKNEKMGVKLGVFNGCLCSSFFQERQWHYLSADIWIMKEYGVENSWTPLFAIRFGSGVDKPFLLIDEEEVVAYNHSMQRYTIMFSLNDEEMLLYTEGAAGRQIVCFNTKEKKCRHAEILQYQSHGLHHILGAIAYKPSFVSLKQVANAEQAMISRAPMRDFEQELVVMTDLVKLRRLWSLMSVRE